jgi:hypothetical protein
MARLLSTRIIPLFHVNMVLTLSLPETLRRFQIKNLDLQASCSLQSQPAPSLSAPQLAP